MPVCFTRHATKKMGHSIRYCTQGLFVMSERECQVNSRSSNGPPLTTCALPLSPLMYNRAIVLINAADISNASERLPHTYRSGTCKESYCSEECAPGQALCPYHGTMKQLRNKLRSRTAASHQKEAWRKEKEEIANWFTIFLVGCQVKSS